MVNRGFFRFCQAFLFHIAVFLVELIIEAASLSFGVGGQFVSPYSSQICWSVLMASLRVNKMQKKSPMGHSIVFNCCGILVPFLSASEGHPKQARAPREALLIAVILAATTTA